MTKRKIVEYGGTLLEQTFVDNDDPAYQSRVQCAVCPDGVRLELIESKIGDPAEPLGVPVEDGDV